MINYSILENFETKDGQIEIYVQATHNGQIALSFDRPALQIMQYLEIDDAKELAKRIRKVIKEIEVSNGHDETVAH